MSLVFCLGPKGRLPASAGGEIQQGETEGIFASMAKAPAEQAIQQYEALVERLISAHAASLDASRQYDQRMAKYRQNERHVASIKDAKIKREAEISLAKEHMELPALNDAHKVAMSARARAEGAVEVAKMRAWLAIRMVGTP